MSAPNSYSPRDIVGRREERDRIVALCLTPNENGMVVVGGRGSGKSRLLYAACSDAPIRARLIRPNPNEADLPLSGFSTLLAATGDPRAIDFVGRLGLEMVEPDALFVAAREALAFVRGLQLEPTLVLIDDADTMDVSSRLLIGFMAGRLTGTNLRIVVAARGDDRKGPFSGFEHVQLPPLPSSDCYQLALGIAGSDPAGILHILVAASAGIPAVLIESLHELSPAQIRGAESVTLPLRTHTTAAAAGEIRPGTEGDLLDHLALAPLTHVEALAALHPEWRDAIENLLESDDLIAHHPYVRIDDPITRSALYWRLGAAERRRRHELMARASESLSAELEMWHLSFTTPHNDDVIVGLLSAASALAERGERDACVEFAERALRLERARRLERPPGTHSGRILDLAEVLLRRGHIELASRYVEYTRQNSSEARASLRQASIWLSIIYARNAPVPDTDVTTTARELEPTDPVGAAGLLDLAAVCQGARGEIRLATASLQQASIVLAGEHESAAHGRSVAFVRTFDGQYPPRETNQLETASLMNLSPEELLTLGTTFTQSERYDDARRVLALAGAVNRMSAPVWSEMAGYLAAGNEIAAGRFHSARAQIEEWEQWSVPQIDPRSTRLYLRAWRAVMSDHRDDATALFLECLERAASENNRAVAAAVYALQGSLALLERDDDGARVLLEFADKTAAEIRNPAIVRHSSDLVEAYVATGRIAEAKRVRSFVAEHGARESRWHVLAMARIDANLAPPRERRARFEICISSYAPSDSPIELAKTLANAARFTDQSDPAEQQRANSAARLAFEHAGAAVCARLLRLQEPPPASGASPVFDLLTPEERRITELVCQGLRNKEIASALFLSLSSVEAKLTQIYRKCNARTRSHLVAMLTGVSA